MKKSHDALCLSTHASTAGTFIQPMTTYSIAACDPHTGESGVGVQSKYLAVGALVPWVKAGVGAAASQAATNGVLARKALALLETGRKPADAAALVLAEDPGASRRQLGVAAMTGDSAAHTGADCLPHAGQITGPGFSCQGNCLAGPLVLEAMAAAFRTIPGDLPQRLLAALQAAENAGGDARGSQSAALLVTGHRKDYHGGAATLTDLRVDDHPDPVAELDRLLQRHRLYYAANYTDRAYPFGPHLQAECRSWALHLGIIGQGGDGEGENQTETAPGAALAKALQDFALRRLGGTFGSQEGMSAPDGWIGGAVIHQLATAYFEREAEALRARK